MEKINNKLYIELVKLLNEIIIDFGGGCSVEKAYIMAWLIVNYKLKYTVDIGVYRGRSFFPQALAHKRFTKGIVYGIDPWDNELARESDNIEIMQQLDEFLDKTNLCNIYDEVNQYILEKDFKDYCVLVRKKSEDAISELKGNSVHFSLIHIDGNHDTEIVMKDIELYCPLLAEKGFLVLDDISWDSVKPAYNDAGLKYRLVFEKIDVRNDYAIFWNNSNAKQVARLARGLKDLNSELESVPSGHRSVMALIIELKRKLLYVTSRLR